VGQRVFAHHLPQNFNLVDHDKNRYPTLSNGPTEAIHLIAAEASDTVDSEEHDVATGGPTEGRVNFTVVSGVRSGSQLLRKPVVFYRSEITRNTH